LQALPACPVELSSPPKTSTKGTVLKGHAFTRADKPNHVDVEHHRLLKTRRTRQNASGHDCSRADKTNRIWRASAPAGFSLPSRRQLSVFPEPVIPNRSMTMTTSSPPNSLRSERVTANSPGTLPRLPSWPTKKGIGGHDTCSLRTFPVHNLNRPRQKPVRADLCRHS